MRKRLFELVVLVSIALGAGPVGAAIWNWSTTPASNATADPSINWSEGMAPSAVNDSARAMMAVLAAWRNDISAVNTTSGSSSTYGLLTSEGVNTTPSNGQMLAFIAHTANISGATLQVDGGNIYPIRYGGAAIPSGTLIANTPYRASFSLANSAWVIEGAVANPFSVPLGAILPFTGGVSPNSNFIIPAGQCISRTVYAAYFAIVSTTFGACDGVTTFGVPDLRGRIIASLDGGTNRIVNVFTGCIDTMGNLCGGSTATLTTAQIPSHTHANVLNDPGHSHSYTLLSGALRNDGTSALTVNTSFVGATTGTSTTGMSITNASAGGGTAFSIMQPTMQLNSLLRVL